MMTNEKFDDLRWFIQTNGQCNGKSWQFEGEYYWKTSFFEHLTHEGTEYTRDLEDGTISFSPMCWSFSTYQILGLV